MTDQKTTNDTDQPGSRSADLSALQFVLIVAGILLLIVAFFFGRAYIDWRNGCQVRLHPRANRVNPASVLRLPVPATAEIPGQDLRTPDRRAPRGYGAEVLLQRADSTSTAAEIFDDLCQNGWSFDRANNYNRSDFTYGGQGDQRFCASQVIQNRLVGYVPICTASKHFVSYIIVQRGDVVFAAYEVTTRLDDTGQYAKEALSKTMIEIRRDAE